MGNIFFEMATDILDDNGLKPANHFRYPVTKNTNDTLPPPPQNPRPAKTIQVGSQEFDLDSSVIVTKYGAKAFAVWLVGGINKPEGHKELLSVALYKKGAQAVRKLVMELQAERTALQYQLAEVSRQQRIA